MGDPRVIGGIIAQLVAPADKQLATQINKNGDYTDDAGNVVQSFMKEPSKLQKIFNPHAAEISNLNLRMNMAKLAHKQARVQARVDMGEDLDTQPYNNWKGANGDQLKSIEPPTQGILGRLSPANPLASAPLLPTKSIDDFLTQPRNTELYKQDRETEITRLLNSRFDPTQSLEQAKAQAALNTGTVPEAASKAQLTTQLLGQLAHSDATYNLSKQGAKQALNTQQLLNDSTRATNVDPLQIKQAGNLAQESVDSYDQDAGTRELNRNIAEKEAGWKLKGVDDKGQTDVNDAVTGMAISSLRRQNIPVTTESLQNEINKQYINSGRFTPGSGYSVQQRADGTWALGKDPLGMSPLAMQEKEAMDRINGLTGTGAAPTPLNAKFGFQPKATAQESTSVPSVVDVAGHKGYQLRTSDKSLWYNGVNVTDMAGAQDILKTAVEQEKKKHDVQHLVGKTQTDAEIANLKAKQAYANHAKMLAEEHVPASPSNIIAGGLNNSLNDLAQGVHAVGPYGLIGAPPRLIGASAGLIKRALIDKPARWFTAEK